jgi:hypothetical protein
LTFYTNSYDNTGNAYNVTKILSKDQTLDLEKYREYSPIFLSTTFALQYGLSFATIIAVVVHTGLYHGKEIWHRARNARKEPKDIHGKLMETYRDVPQWWFLVMFALIFALGMATVLIWPT